MSVLAYQDTIDPRPITPVGFGTVGGTFVAFRRVFRDSGNNWTLPDWSVNPILNRFQIPSGGVYVQRGGYDTDKLNLRCELQNVADAETLRTLTGYVKTLVLPNSPYETLGAYNWVHTAGYRTISNVLLSAIDATEGITVRGNYPRVALTFEVNRA